MKILLDTHVLLWTLMGSKKLSRKAKDLITDPDNEVYISIISPWEVELKHNKYPDRMPIDSSTLLQFCKHADFSYLSIRPHYIAQLSTLDSTSHADPFDRRLICQAKSEGMTLITCDNLIAQYNEDFILKI